jgi:uncharacterized membrane protein
LGNQKKSAKCDCPTLPNKWAILRFGRQVVGNGCDFFIFDAGNRALHHLG